MDTLLGIGMGILLRFPIEAVLCVVAVLIGIFRAGKSRPPLNYFVCYAACAMCSLASLQTITLMQLDGVAQPIVRTAVEYLARVVVIGVAYLHGRLAGERSIDATNGKGLALVALVPVISLVLALIPSRRTQKGEHEDAPPALETDQGERNDVVESPSLVKTKHASLAVAAFLAWFVLTAILTSHYSTGRPIFVGERGQEAREVLTLEQELQQIANEAPTLAPGDDGLGLVSMEANGTELVSVWRKNAEESGFSVNETALRRGIERACTSQFQRQLIDRGATLKQVYLTRKDRKLGEVAVEEYQCLAWDAEADIAKAIRQHGLTRTLEIVFEPTKRRLPAQMLFGVVLTDLQVAGNEVTHTYAVPRKKWLDEMRGKEGTKEIQKVVCSNQTHKRLVNEGAVISGVFRLNDGGTDDHMVIRTQSCAHR